MWSPVNLKLPTILPSILPSKMASELSLHAFETEHRSQMSIVLHDLYLATHCHSCGDAFPVCLRGYVGLHCSKACWREFELGCDDCPVYGGCRQCVAGNVSLAQSKWHRAYHNSRSPTGVCWPMGNPDHPCHNECIKSRPCVSVYE